MPKVLIVTADGGESYEALYAKHRFMEAGWEPVVAAPTRKALNLVMHDFRPGWDTYVEREGYGMDADLAFAEVNVDDYAAVLILGGRAPEYLRNDVRLLDMIREFDGKRKWIFAICHGIQILAAAGLADGRNVTCYLHVRMDAELGGGKYVADQQCVTDGRIVTAQTWQSHPQFYREIFARLAGGK